MWIWILTALGCASSPSNDATAPKPEADATPAAPTVAEAKVDLAAGSAWGAVFWQGEKALRKGGSDLLLGPKGTATAVPGSATETCGVPETGAPEHAVLALPAGVTPGKAEEAPANPAGLVERAAWRLDELLPPRDAYTPAASSPDPALQRGVRVASVVKTRRRGAPPVLVASGTRDCTSVVAILNADAAKALAVDRLPKSCDPLAVLPPADYNGDGVRETAVYSATRVLLYRLEEGHGSIGLVRIGDWSCP